LNHVREQLTRPPHEWFAGAIFIGSGRLAEKAQARFRIPDAEYGLRSGAGQVFAATASGDLPLNYRQGFSPHGGCLQGSRRFAIRHMRFRDRRFGQIDTSRQVGNSGLPETLELPDHQPT
jgi:hypothetical protein